MPSDSNFDELELLIRAKYALIVLDTVEVERAEQGLALSSSRLNLLYFSWSRSRGLRRGVLSADPVMSNTEEPAKALAAVVEEGAGLFHFRGLGAHLEDPAVVSYVLDVVQQFNTRRGALVLTGLRIVTGAVLSVFSPGERRALYTPTATIGIRGTAVYIEAEEARTYVCTCYGEAEIVSAMDPSAREVVSTKHHEQPRYVMGMGAPQMLMGAPVVNHTDAELTFLEALVGRRPPFVSEPGYQPGSY